MPTQSGTFFRFTCFLPEQAARTVVSVQSTRAKHLVFLAYTAAFKGHDCLSNHYLYLLEFEDYTTQHHGAKSPRIAILSIISASILHKVKHCSLITVSVALQHSDIQQRLDPVTRNFQSHNILRLKYVCICLLYPTANWFQNITCLQKVLKNSVL